MTRLPFGIGMLVRKLTGNSVPSPPSAARVVAGKILGIIGATAMGSAILAPILAALACLANVSGSWVMRYQHSHEAFAFYGGSVQGNYAIAGAAAAVPYIATYAIAWHTMEHDEDAFFFLSIFHYIFAPLPYGAAIGASAAAIGAARGFDMQTLNNSTIATMAGSGYIAALCYFVIVKVILVGAST